jgi:DHA1 family bicyclomycin/chloramphenicol resistance-like MFS transporter
MAKQPNIAPIDVAAGQSTAASPMSLGEFVTLIALMMSLVALSIDTLLPALDQIGVSLVTTNANDVQLVVSIFFLGLSIGQFFFGTLSDFIGRKPAVYTGLSIFLIGCVMSFYSTNLHYMLIGRFFQGIGLAGPRIVSITLIRDQYAGDAMAKIMSFVMSIFILVPILAPSLGQGLLLFVTWRYIFVVLGICAVIVLIWFSIRQPETLPAADRQPFSMKRVVRTFIEIVHNRVSFGYTMVGGLISGIFLGFLGSIQQILQSFSMDQYFALCFAVLAVFLGGASMINARIVSRFGMRRMVTMAFYGIITVAVVFILINFIYRLNFWMVMAFFSLSHFCVGIIFGNINAIAMEPLGHIAGIGSSVIGSFSSLMAVPIGIFIGYCYNGTAMPLVIGFLVVSILSLFIAAWVKKGDDMPMLHKD